MHVFITGGTGLIGLPVVAELIDNRHTVLALARSDASAQAAEAAGAKAWRGDVADLGALRAGVAQSDAVIHLAFGNDYSTAEAVAQSIVEDTAAIETLGDELRGSDRPFVLVSGTPWVTGRPSTEHDPLPTDGPVGGRGRAVNAALALSSQGVRTSAVRMPRTVHNQGKGGFAGLLTDAARRTGVSGYPGDGTQRWPAVHAVDAAVLFRLALEQAPAGTALARSCGRGRRRQGHRDGHRTPARPTGRIRLGGDLRALRTDLRRRSTLLQQTHSRHARMAAHPPKPPGRPRGDSALSSTRAEWPERRDADIRQNVLVPASQPTILATSIGFQPDGGDPWNLRPGLAYSLAAQLAGAGDHPRLCIIATAGGDHPTWLAAMHHAFSKLDMVVSHLDLFPMPNVDDIGAHLARQDIIWVSGGSTANLLALWRLHGLDQILRDAWQAGVVLMGVSAGSICWHLGGTTDSFGLPLQPLTNALGFLPYSNSPHHDAEPERRPLMHRLVADGILSDGYATDNGAGLVYHGTDLHEAVSETPGALAYEIRRDGDLARETPIPTRLLR